MDKSNNESPVRYERKLKRFSRVLLYVLTALQFYFCLIIVVMDINKEYSDISSSIIRNRVLFGFLIISLITALSGWNIGYSTFKDVDEKMTHFYSPSDRTTGRFIAIVSFIFVLTVIFSFTTAALEILK